MNNTKIYLILVSAMALPISALFGQNSGNVIVIPEIANRFANGQFVGGAVGRSGGSQFQSIPGQAIPVTSGANTTIETRRDSGKSDLIFGLNPATPQQLFLLQQQQQQQLGNSGTMGGTVGTGTVGNGTGIPPMSTFGPGTSVPDPAVNAVPQPGVNAVPEPGVNAVPLPPAQFPGTPNNLNQRAPGTQLPQPIPVPGNPGFPIIPVPVPNGNNNQRGNTPGSATPGTVNPGPAMPGTVNPGPATPSAPNPGPRGSGSF